MEGTDRLNISLPGLQEELLQRIKEAAPGVPLVVALMSGGAVSSPWVEANADAVLWTGFNGQFSGAGLFDVLSGRTNPGGRLPYTVPADVAQLPVITNYNYDPQSQDAQDGMGRTYRYINLTSQAPLYPFGFGRSYTSWRYDNLQMVRTAGVCAPVQVTVGLTNSGTRNGSEVAQLYVANEKPQYPSPRWALAGFERVDLAPGETQLVNFTLDALARAEVREEDYERWVMPTSLRVFVGGGQPDQKPEHTTSNILDVALTISGVATKLSNCP